MANVFLAGCAALACRSGDQNDGLVHFQLLCRALLGEGEGEGEGDGGGAADAGERALPLTRSAAGTLVE
jgi:hypothetical protein